MGAVLRRFASLGGAFVVGLLPIALVMLALADSASAHAARFQATSTAGFDDQDDFEIIDGQYFVYDDPDQFHGRISSSKAACVVDRRVRVFRQSDNALMGTARSEADGDWFITSEDPGSGMYYAKIAAMQFGSAGHDHVCRKVRVGFEAFDFAVSGGS